LSPVTRVQVYGGSPIYSRKAFAMKRKVSLAIFDFDGTLLEGNVWRVLLQYFRKKKKRRLRLALFLFYHLLPLPLFKIGLFPKERYFSMWAKNLSWLLKGLTQREADLMFDEMVREWLLPGLRKELLKKMEMHRREGEIPVIDSGTFTPLLKKLAEFVGVEYVIGTDLEVKDGKLTGRTVGKFNSGSEKISRVEEAFKSLGMEIDWQNSYAYADSIFDIPLLLKVGNPVAVTPDEELAKLAQKRGWDVLSPEAFKENIQKDT